MIRWFGHPSKRSLRHWLDDGEPGIDAHVAGCEQCASRLEDLSQPAQPLGEALRATLAPPQDLQPRLRVGIARKMQNRDDLRLLAELMGIPLQTIRALATPPPSHTEDDQR